MPLEILFISCVLTKPDVLNRFPYIFRKPGQIEDQHRGLQDDVCHESLDPNYWSTVHVMMYIFPREFGLHNVFTSYVDPRETVQPLKDYTLREEEIASKYSSRSKNDLIIKTRIPRRLRGKAVELVQKMRISHSRCSYNELLKSYSPLLVSSCVLTIGNTADKSGILPSGFGDGNAADYV
jgi:hypothetical protein